MTIVDFNADGLNDLAISAPSVGSETLDYNGQVYIYLNNEVTGISSVPSITIDCTVGNHLSLSAFLYSINFILICITSFKIYLAPSMGYSLFSYGIILGVY